MALPRQPPKKQQNIDYEYIIERRINESDRRIDVHFQERLDSVEKLLNMTITTKAEALAIAINRIQGERDGCKNRCVHQVEKFTEMIRELDTKFSAYTIDEMKRDIRDLRVHADEEKVLIDDLKTKNAELEKWKSGFWVKNAGVMVITGVTVVNLLIYGFTWFVDFATKLHGMQGGQ